MNDNLKRKLELFAENRIIMSKNFTFEYALMQCLSAYIYADHDKVIDPGKIKECKKIIRANTKLFSSFKDISYLAVATSLSLHNDPEAVFQQTQKVYEMMKENKFRSSTYLATSALMIAEHAEHWDYVHIVRKAAQIYTEMKDNHPLLTSRDDYGYACMLAMSDIEVAQLIQGMEDVYGLMKSDFFSNNAVQSLSHVLTLSTEDAAVKRARVLDIFEKLKNQKCRYGTGHELSTLGVLALFEGDPDEMIQDIVEAEKYLRSCKGFGMSVGKPARIMYASAMVASEKLHGIEDLSLRNSMSGAITKSIIAIQTAIIASATAATAAAAAASTNS